MRIELRSKKTEDGQIVPRGLCLIADSKDESLILDEVFGSKVGDDGLISVRKCECRLSDGYGEHYIYVDAEPSHFANHVSEAGSQLSVEKIDEEIRRLGEIARYSAEIQKLRRILANVPAKVAFKAKEDAGFGKHELTDCAEGQDGECNHEMCPQIRDDEPKKTGRHCPLPNFTDDDEY